MDGCASVDIRCQLACIVHILAAGGDDFDRELGMSG